MIEYPHLLVLPSSVTMTRLLLVVDAVVDVRSSCFLVSPLLQQ
jgi:hypothetical protein